MARAMRSSNAARRAAGWLAGAALLAFALGAAPAGGRVRPPAVAGQFYPGQQAALRASVRSFLAAARAAPGERPLALVLPHAGHVFCGQIMADGYRQVQGRDYDLVIVLGTNHTSPGLRGAAVDTRDAYATPLGRVAIDREAAAALVAAERACVDDPAPFAREHSLEVQLPFLQEVLPDARILPVVVGAVDPGLSERIGRAVAAVARERVGGKALIIASSDLSHYPAKADAESVDRAVLEAVASLDPARVRATIDRQMRRNLPGLSTCACGEAPILVAMSAARALGADRGQVLGYANSGDVPQGDPRRVVGYGAVAFTASGGGGSGVAPGESGAGAAPAAGSAASGRLGDADRRALFALAREAIRSHLESGAAPPAPLCAGALAARRGVFVTLKKQGELRGCIGHLADDLPLCQAVAAMAAQAAFNDRRFAPLARHELAAVELEISVLTPPVPVSGPDAIVTGRDGVILRQAGRSAVFLPQVATEQGWDRDTFLTQLALKAGLPPDAWRSGAELLAFQADVYRESERP